MLVVLYEIFKNFVVLMFGHAIADFGLQSEAMAKFKNPKNKPTAPEGQKQVPVWWCWLGAHGLIHGGIVYLITGIWWLGLCETFAHVVIDWNKMKNVFGPNEDQGLHILFKLIYAGWLMFI